MTNSTGPRAALARPEPGLRHVRASNPSPMTYTGTNTWIIGTGAVAIIDPGPNDPTHLDAVMSALEPDEVVEAILVTHAHRDHSCLAPELSARTGAPVYGAGNMVGRRRPMMAELAQSSELGGGEGVDQGFVPDHVVEGGALIEGSGWSVDVIATPGHTADHLCFAWRDAVFTGDHVMGWASSLVSPPDGDLVSFMESCARLAERPARTYYAGHGEAISDPKARLAWLVEHRNSRTRQIKAELAKAPAPIPTLTAAIYQGLEPRLVPAAQRNVLAHLIALFEASEVGTDGDLSPDSTFRLLLC